MPSSAGRPAFPPHDRTKAAEGRDPTAARSRSAVPGAAVCRLFVTLEPRDIGLQRVQLTLLLNSRDFSRGVQTLNLRGESIDLGEVQLFVRLAGLEGLLPVGDFGFGLLDRGVQLE